MAAEEQTPGNTEAARWAFRAGVANGALLRVQRELNREVPTDMTVLDFYGQVFTNISNIVREHLREEAERHDDEREVSG